jgi:hypothetical protein
VEIERPQVGQVVERVRDHSLQLVARQIPAIVQFIQSFIHESIVLQRNLDS